MYPTSNVNNVNVQKIPSQPLYDPPVYAQSAMNQSGNQQAQPCQPPYLGWSQSIYNGYPQGAANPLIRQPMMYPMNGYPINNGAQYLPVYQYAPQQQMPMNMGYSNAPIHNGQSATHFRSDIPPPVIADNVPTFAQSGNQHHVKQGSATTSDNQQLNLSVEIPPSVAAQNSASNPEEEKKDSSSSTSSSSEELLQEVDRSRIEKFLSVIEAKKTQNAPQDEEAPVLSEIKPNSLQQHCEQQMSIQKQILKLFRPRNSLKPAEPKSYTIAVERFKALIPEELMAPEFEPKEASMVFIYDVDDITQLSTKILQGVRRLFPDVKNVSKAIESVKSHFINTFFEYSEGLDYEDRDMTVRDGILGGKVSGYLNFINECERSGPNMIYELIKAQQEASSSKNPEKTEQNNVELSQVIEFQKLFEPLWENAKKCLQAIFDKSLKNTYNNVVLCDEIGYGSAQLNLSGLASYVPLENLYASYAKERALERIQRDYVDDCVFVVVTSNRRTIEAAEKKNILVWRVEGTESFDELYTAQKFHMLK